MRFILGVLIGGAVTLGIATVFDGPAQQLLGHAASVTEDESAWQRFLVAAGKKVFPVVEAPGDARAPAVEVPFQAEASAAAASESAPPRTIEPPALESDAQAMPAAIEPPAIEPDAEAPAPAAPAAQGVMQPLPELASPARVASHEELLPAQNGVEPVWVPFRSASSAQGFAARLQRSTEHPFIVTRQGPGRYQVSFEYANALQREQLLAKIDDATGQAAK